MSNEYYKLNQTGPKIQDILNKVQPTLAEGRGDIVTSDEISNNLNLENGSGTNSLQQKTIKTNEPNIASGYESVAFNHETQAVQKACAAFGGGTIAGDNSIQDAESTYGFSFAIGEMSKAKGRGSFSSGNTTSAEGMYSSTFGYKTKALQDWQHVVGAMNSYAHDSYEEDLPLSNIDNALFIVGNGFETEQVDEEDVTSYTAVVGSDAFAVYKDGHAELAAQGTTDKSVVIKESVTTDLRKGAGTRSIIQIHGAEANEASGQSAIALGMGNIAAATRAVTIGEGLIGYVGNTTYVGKYNDSSIKNTLFVVGNGSNNSDRSNALTVYKNGDVTIGSMGSSLNSITTKRYVDTGLTNKRSTLSGNNLLYATNNTGAQSSVSYSKVTTTGSNSIVQRDNGQIKVLASPVANDDATSKQYVEQYVNDAVTNVLTEQEAYAILSGGNI